MFEPVHTDRRTAMRWLLTFAGCSLAFVGQFVAPLSAQQPSPEESSRGAPAVEADIDLNDMNYETWRDHILPDLSEMAWNKIPWLSTFHDGILAADAAAKPLLLWTMNGHPLGCT